MVEGHPAVRFRDVVFRWPGAGRPCIDIPAFELARGDQVFLQGPSGSGKSTLLSLVGGVVLPERGGITVLGVPMERLGAQARDRHRAAHIGFIFQLFNLIPYLSGLDNIVLPCRFSQQRARRAQPSPREEALRLAGCLDLDSHTLRRPAAELSVGQQQRVAAARALIGRPELIIADEPTSALDAGRQRVFLDLLLEQCAEAGSSLLFVSHDERLASRFPSALRLDEINRAGCFA
ncbi:MAG: ATP-binding cassette domain-containing protein [Rhodocyclaceae bacterium]|nr:ATP-binding cassette domain-containing protein [Rhodocyclaceae bacterium]